MREERRWTLRQHQEIVGQQPVASPQERGAETRLAVSRLAEKCHSLATDRHHGGVKRIEALFDQRERKRLAEQVAVKRLARTPADRPRRDRLAVSRDDEFKPVWPE